MRYRSPLRYPGGKARLAPLLAGLIRAQRPTPAVYAEPYAGGAGAGLHLLADGVVEQVHLNDADPGLAAFWRTITTPRGAEAFCRLIEDTPVTIEEWHRQREVYHSGCGDDLRLGFAAFFLNRTNRSGILDAGPIGGESQQGRWRLDARYNKCALTARVRMVAAMGGRIRVHEGDGVDFLEGLSPMGANLFVYADPPYVAQGGRLYAHSFAVSDHERLAAHLLEAPYPWVASYDAHPLVCERLYGGVRRVDVEMDHSAAVRRTGREVLVLAPGLRLPTGWNC